MIENDCQHDTYIETLVNKTFKNSRKKWLKRMPKFYKVKCVQCDVKQHKETFLKLCSQSLETEIDELHKTIHTTKAEELIKTSDKTEEGIPYKKKSCQSLFSLSLLQALRNKTVDYLKYNKLNMNKKYYEQIILEYKKKQYTYFQTKIPIKSFFKKDYMSDKYYYFTKNDAK
ncbi:hypothetical protein AB837_00463 [bacterium AB1]|nr:hypothetical protein AB837_00463 [bacterium AB1]